jgi:hypothetical protein
VYKGGLHVLLLVKENNIFFLTWENFHSKFEEVCYGRQTITNFWSHQIQQSEMAILPASLKGIPMLLKRNILDLYIVIVM